MVSHIQPIVADNCPSMLLPPLLFGYGQLWHCCIMCRSCSIKTASRKKHKLSVQQSVKSFRSSHFIAFVHLEDDYVQMLHGSREQHLHNTASDGKWHNFFFTLILYDFSMQSWHVEVQYEPIDLLYFGAIFQICSTQTCNKGMFTSP